MIRFIGNSFAALFCAALAAAEPLPRVISLSPAVTEIICHLGRQECLVGRSEACNFPETVKSLPAAGHFGIPFVEKCLSLKPDLVITNTMVSPGAAELFRKRGIRTLILRCETMADYRKCVQTIGEEVKAQENASAEIKKFDAWLKRPVKPLKLRVLWVVWDTPLLVPGADSLLNSLLQKAGAENLTADNKKPYYRCSFDRLLKDPPDVIVWTASPGGWKKRSVWRKIPAAVIEPQDKDSCQRPGPRIYEAVGQLRRDLEQIAEKRK